MKMESFLPRKIVEHNHKILTIGELESTNRKNTAQFDVF